MLTNAYYVLTVLAMGVLIVLALLCLVRCIRGPRTADRVMAVNMVGTLTILMIAILILMRNEGYLADITLVYAMLSFLAVVVLCKIYTGFYREKQHAQALKQNQMSADIKKMIETENLIAADPISASNTDSKEAES